MAWYTSAGGTTCVAAYNAVGASSLANSYVNLVNPGTNNAAPGTAPTWAYGTGWTFNGSTQYLTTGVVPADGYSVLIRVSSASGGNVAFGSRTSGDNGMFFHTNLGALNWIGYRFGAQLTVTPTITSGVFGCAGKTAYRNGSSDGTIGAGSCTTIYGAYIGCLNNGGSASTFWTGNIQAIAIYSGTLSAADVATITTAMNALPVTASLGLPVIAHHWHQVFGGGH